MNPINGSVRHSPRAFLCFRGTRCSYTKYRYGSERALLPAERQKTTAPAAESTKKWLKILSKRVSIVQQRFLLAPSLFRSRLAQLIPSQFGLC